MRAVLGVAVLAGMLVSATPAFALTPRVAVCGRVTSFVAVPPPGRPTVRLGTEERRRLGIGGSVPPQVGQEICVWGVDVQNVNTATPDPAPKGIEEWQIVSVASIGCADGVTATSALFTMPGEKSSALPDHATLALPLSAGAGSACVRIAVDAQGNPSPSFFRPGRHRQSRCLRQPRVFGRCQARAPTTAAHSRSR
ncbi:MAG TPA: hypothetical protein VGR87_09190 [Candidatus Limnocylindria bacterium]|nr:hypothetical protein [Candidatus Limnocylindria bacterium]